MKNTDLKRLRLGATAKWCRLFLLSARDTSRASLESEISNSPHRSVSRWFLLDNRISATGPICKSHLNKLICPR